MYDYIKGIITYTEIDHVVIETAGIGYRIFCGNPSAIPVNDKREAILYVHHHVREDIQALYGFATREERRMFRLLLEVSGIGPKGANAIIASANPQQIALAIAQEDVKFLTRFPGIGQKTAKRLILDLKDKLKAQGFSRQEELTQLYSADLSLTNEEGGQGFLEALEALIVLGFSEGEVVPVLKEIAKEHPEPKADQLIKLALKNLQKF